MVLLALSFLSLNSIVQNQRITQIILNYMLFELWRPICKISINLNNLMKQAFYTIFRTSFLDADRGNKTG